MELFQLYWHFQILLLLTSFAWIWNNHLHTSFSMIFSLTMFFSEGGKASSELFRFSTRSHRICCCTWVLVTLLNCVCKYAHKPAPVESMRTRSYQLWQIRWHHPFYALSVQFKTFPYSESQQSRFEKETLILDLSEHSSSRCLGVKKTVWVLLLAIQFLYSRMCPPVKDP